MKWAIFALPLMLFILLSMPLVGCFTLYDFYACTPSSDPFANTLANNQEMRELSQIFLTLTTLNISLIVFSIYRRVYQVKNP